MKRTTKCRFCALTFFLAPLLSLYTAPTYKEESVVTPVTGRLSCSQVGKWDNDNVSRPVALTFARIGQHGRLGNQLFQISATIGIADSNNLTWGFPESISTTSAGRLFNLQGNSSLKVLRCLEYLEENENTYNISLPMIPANSLLSLHGYFQSWQYFEQSAHSLRDFLQLDPKLITSVKKEVPQVMLPNSVTLHVRRGDYEKLPRQYQLLDKSYYIGALSAIEDIDVVIIVSDDVVWCKEHLIPSIKHNVIIPPPGDELFDFVLLHLGKHIVIANSTYSWWAAFLKVIYGRNFGVTVAPSKMFKSGGVLSHLNRPSFFHPSWHIVEV